MKNKVFLIKANFTIIFSSYKSVSCIFKVEKDKKVLAW